MRSIQFVGVPDFSRFVWSAFRIECALMCLYPACLNFASMVDDRHSLDGVLIAPLFHVRNSGLFGVMVSGGILCVPVFLRLM